MLKKAQVDNERIDKAIEELENAIISADPEDTKKYTKMVTNLETLRKLRQADKPSKLEKKDWLPIAANLAGIVVVCVFEASGHTIVSKSLGFISKQKS